MYITILDQNLQAVGVLDDFLSLIWTDRYNRVGEFEIFSNLDVGILAMLQGGFLKFSNSEHLMIPDIFSLTSVDSKMTIKGRAAESILERRVIISQTQLNGDLEAAIQTVLNSHFIAPSDPNRTIDILSFAFSNDSSIEALTVEAQVTGGSVLELVQYICRSLGIGFKMTPTISGSLIFELYVGVDRSFTQIGNPYVTFSKSYGNVSETGYDLNSQYFRNVPVVAGEGEGSARYIKIVEDPQAPYVGLARKEVWVDARDISRTTQGGTLPEVDYLRLLENRGLERIRDWQDVESFTTKLTSENIFVYRRDFDIGDMVTVIDELTGNIRSVRISEMTTVIDENGVNIYPTLETEEGSEVI